MSWTRSSVRTRWPILILTLHRWLLQLLRRRSSGKITRAKRRSTGKVFFQLSTTLIRWVINRKNTHQQSWFLMVDMELLMDSSINNFQRAQLPRQEGWAQRLVHMEDCRILNRWKLTQPTSSTLPTKKEPWIIKNPWWVSILKLKGRSMV